MGGLRRGLLAAHNFVFCATDWDGMSSEDLPTTIGLIIPDLSNFPVLIDRVQQGMLNFLYLGRAMIHPQGFSSHPAFRDEGEPVLDTSGGEGASSGFALVWWDSGSPVPPTTNTADHAGRDPHEQPRRQPTARRQKAAFLQVDGKVIDVCDGLPCVADPTLNP